MALAGDSEENDEKIQAFRAAQLHTRQAQQFNEKANYLQELLNLQSLHANVDIMPAYFTLLQEEIDKLLGNAEEEVTIIYLCFPVSQLYNPLIPLHMFQTHLNFLVKEVIILFYCGKLSMTVQTISMNVGCVAPLPCRPRLCRPNRSYVAPTSELCRPNIVVVSPQHQRFKIYRSIEGKVCKIITM